jgi:hypothetical protein
LHERIQAEKIVKAEGIYNEFISQKKFREAARILSVSGKYSMKWANALPIKNYGIKLTNNVFQIAARLALGCQ